MHASAFVSRTVLAVVVLSAPACRSKSTAAPDEPTGTPSAAPSGAVEIAMPIPSGAVETALNPGKEKPYSGPIGAVHGVVRVSGDPSPELPLVKQKVPAGRCDDGRAFYGTLFREGTGRELGDVLVAVTGYKGYVEEKEPVKLVKARGCAFESRTIAMVFGQRLDVKNRGPETFIPHLVGAKQAAILVAMPNGEPVKIFPTHVGEYELMNESLDFARAAVFVLKYPTFAVTGLDGKFDITGIPAGEVTLSAMLPATRQVVQQKVNIVAGESATVDLTIAFNAAANTPPAASASAASSPSK